MSESSTEVRPCPSGHRDRYADGSCRPCAIGRAKENKRKQTIVSVNVTGIAPRLDAAARRLGVSRNAFANQAVMEKLAGSGDVALSDAVRLSRQPRERTGSKVGIHVHVPPDLADLVEERAWRSGLSRSSYARRLLMAGLAVLDGREAKAV